MWIVIVHEFVMIGYILLSAHCMQIMQMHCLFSVFVFLCNWPLFQSSAIAGLLCDVDYSINVLF